MKYISLREASQISGYAPDYIGQLIRSGKLSGKQVYSNVAWVTTEAALRDYLKKQPRAKSAGSSKSSYGPSWNEGVEVGSEVPVTEELIDRTLPKFLKGFLVGVVAVSICFAILLFYIFSVQIDARLKANAIKNSQLNTTQN